MNKDRQRSSKLKVRCPLLRPVLPVMLHEECLSTMLCSSCKTGLHPILAMHHAADALLSHSDASSVAFN